MKVQVIERDGHPEWAVIRYEDYLALLEKAELMEDIVAFDSAMAAVESGEETIPLKVVDSLLAGESPIRVWREYRNLTQAQLAEQAGVKQSYIAMLEAGERQGTVDVLVKIARVLKVDVDDLLPQE
jgi:DNA-binding XRE family transcriptional regulator